MRGRRTLSNHAVHSSSRMLGVSGSKSEGEHLALRGLMCAMLAGASGSEWPEEELELATLLISTIGP